MSTEFVDENTARQLIQDLRMLLGVDWVQEQLAIRVRRAEALGRWHPDEMHGNPIVDSIAVFERDDRAAGFAVAIERPAGRRLLSAASDVHHVVRRLPPRKAADLAALLRRTNPRGFLHQCRIAAHHLRDGYELRSFSLGEGPDGDVVVGSDSTEVEVQCKSLDPGAGRRILNATFNSLAYPVLNMATELDWRGKVELECDVRLRDEHIPLVSDAIIARMKGESHVPSLPLEYTLRCEGRTSNVTDDEAAAVLRLMRGNDHRRPHVAVVGNRFDDGGVRMMLVARSKKQDTVLGKLLATANAAGRQLRGDLPGVVCVHVPETMDWGSVRDAGVLAKHVHGLTTRDLSKARAVVFTSEDDEQGAYVLPNPRARRDLPKGFRLFGTEPSDL